MHRFEFAVEDATENLELQLDVAQVLVRIVANIVLLDQCVAVLEANLLRQSTCHRVVAGEENEVLVVDYLLDWLCDALP